MLKIRFLVILLLVILQPQVLANCPTPPELASITAMKSYSKGVLTGDSNGNIQMYDTELKTLKTIPGHHGNIVALLFMAETQEWISVGSDRHIKRWNQEFNLISDVKVKGAEPLWSAALLPQNRVIVSDIQGSYLQELKSGSSTKTLRQVQCHAYLQYSPVLNSIACEGIHNKKNAILLLDAKDFQIRHQWPEKYPVTGLKFSPNGQFLVWGSEDETIHMAESEQGKIRKWNIPSFAKDFYFDAKAKLLISNIDGEIHQIDLKNNQLMTISLNELTMAPWLNFLDASSDGKRLYVGTDQGIITKFESADLDNKFQWESFLGLIQEKKYQAIESFVVQNKVDPELLNKAIFEAIHRDDQKLLEKLIASGAPIHGTNTEGETALMMAVRQNKILFVKVLLDHKANLFARDKAGDQVLHVAARNTGKNAVEILKYLLQSGADPKALNHKSESPFWVALKQGEMPFIEAFQKAGCALPSANVEGINPLMLIAENGNFKLLQEFHKQNPALLQQKDKSGNSLLHYAARSGNIKLCNWVLANKIPINAKNQDGVPAIAYARSKPILEWMSQQGADLDWQDKHGNRIMDYLLLDPDMLSFLLKKHINIDYINAEGRTVLFQLIESDELLKVFLPAFTKSIATLDAHHQSVFHYLAARPNLSPEGQKLIQLAVQSGVDINGKDKFGDTALLLSVKQEFLSAENFEPLIKMFVQHSVNLNIQDAKGRSALNLLLSRDNAFGLKKSIRLLVKQGADLHLKDHQGCTAAELIKRDPLLKL